jgi:hypothetical protein
MWTKDTRPARKNYWARRTLEKRKIKNMLNNGQAAKKKDGKTLTRVECKLKWQKDRSCRIPDGFNGRVIEVTK